MGFGEVWWMKWMEALIFSSKILVLVNSSPTKEFMVERGLRQGDSLSPFLVVIVAEGLKFLVNKAVESGDFVGCYMKGKCFADVLQFADDTLLVGNKSWKHLWAIKSVLRGFELVSGLGINFNKSKLVGININSHFLEVATAFLCCRTESNEFSFLGSLPIFTLSFYKAPKKIIREINKIQSNFLWGSVEEKRIIHWMSWNDVCLPVDKGGLGLSKLEDFNTALLLKWRWRILEASNFLGYCILKARYRDIMLQVAIEGGKLDKYSYKSVWWSDIISLEKRLLEEFLRRISFSMSATGRIHCRHGRLDRMGVVLE
ncbi:uncharacterized protein LOC131596916 [Vicia villosa]|uniref:uncharacterized protein LOC131596916 n=1 Tax=Vicia villosa TaxID=3911 RepID=UPI00273CCEC6|nr:uncharacterized protein LOC131596916 [Vicia villosa]